MSESQYFAAKPSDETAATLLSRANAWYNQLHSNGYLSKVKNMWMAYHGCYFTGPGSSHRITFGGEQGELVNLAVNHIRNLAQHMLVMITANRPTMTARATNSDYKSIVQTKLAEGLLDYYMREKRLEKFLRTATEYAIVFGSGYIKMAWNSTTGEVYEISEETGAEIYEGDVEFKNLSPFDVVFDMSKETAYEQDWVMTRTFKNKFDLAAKFPEFEDRIKGMQTKSDIYRYRMDILAFDQTDDVPVYEFFHRRTESLPEGRYLLFLDSDVVLMDTPMPYRDLPVYRIAPQEILGTPFGYTPMFDLLPLQDSVNSLYSTILSNQNAFGVQNIYVPRQAEVSFKALEGGLNIIEGNSAGGKPESLNLTNTPKEIFDFVQMLEQKMETISGINSVARGNPEASLKSGAALALVQSQALQFMSGLQQQYVQLVEDIGTGLINMLKDFAAVPRIRSIVGKSNATYIQKEFSGDDLSQVNRIIVDMGNPLSRCLAKDTLVIMSDGSKKVVQDIVPGDTVMGPDSTPRTVKVTSSGFDNMYRITSKNKNRNVDYTVNSKHILTLKYCTDGRGGPSESWKKGDILDISVSDYLKLPSRRKNILTGFSVGIELPEKNLPIDPYILGSWIGDGTSAETAITTMDNEIRDAWFDYSEKIGMQFRKSTSESSGRASTYFITSGERNGVSNRNIMKNELNALELINNKHIPNYYLTSSKAQRLELLAGLIDTDGHLAGNGYCYQFTQKSDRISNDVISLAKSLGFKVTNTKYTQKPSKLVKTESLVNKITIAGDIWTIPVKVERKKSKINFNKLRDNTNYGINVEYVGINEFYGFELLEEPHFLLGDYTVTHNTTAGKLQLAEQMMQYGVIKNAEDILSVMETGRLDVMTDESYREQMLIREENEALAEGREVRVLGIDRHIEHINHHKTLLADPRLRLDDELTARVLQHIQEHINELRNFDPGLLQLIGQQPLGPVGGTPPSQPTPDINQSAPMNPEQGPMGAPPGPAELPNMPSMPQVDANMLPNPELQQQALGNVQE